jgi:hypothetical protein
MSARPFVLALAVLLTACFSEHTTPPDDTVSFAADVEPLLNGSCAFSGCHGTTNTQPGNKPMRLTTGQAYDAIVNVSSAQLLSMNRITPGDPDQSYLIHKLQGTHQGVGGTGGRMPAGQSPLAPSVIAMMRQWVSQGARRN